MKGPGRYTKEFKVEAVRLLNQGNKPASDLALELGVKRTLLYRWKDQVAQSGESAFCGSGRPRNDELSEVAKLRKENASLREERDILKKTAAYFARDLK